MTKVATVTSSASVWWIVTPDGDVYPEELGNFGNQSIRMLVNSRGGAVRRTRDPNGRGADPVHEFTVDRGDGLPTPLGFSRMHAVAKAEEARLGPSVPGPSVPSPTSFGEALPALSDGHSWWIVF